MCVCVFLNETLHIIFGLQVEKTRENKFFTHLEAKLNFTDREGLQDFHLAVYELFMGY